MFTITVLLKGLLFLLAIAFVVWSIQQSWRLSSRYSYLYEMGAPPGWATFYRAWQTRRVAAACSAGRWGLLSLLAVLALPTFMHYWFSLTAQGSALSVFTLSVPVLSVSTSSASVLSVSALSISASSLSVLPASLKIAFNALQAQPLFEPFSLALPAVFVALWRIDRQLYLLPDPLLFAVALLGALQRLLSGQQGFFHVLLLLLLFLGVAVCLRLAVEKPRLRRLFQWLGAGDIKFLWAASFWLLPSQIVLMWCYAALSCWLHHAWQQRCLLPRGHSALGPYLILGWVGTMWGQPALQ